MTEWISVKDRLPDFNILVLGTDGTNYCLAESFDNGCNKGICRIEDEIECDGPYKLVYHITHWMPLPKLPEVNDD